MFTDLDLRKITIRTFGLVQDPGDFGNLKRVVQVFDEKSKMHHELKEIIIPKLVEEEYIRKRLLMALDVRPLKISYKDLVGTGCSVRKLAKCNAIIQATVPGQQRPYIADWPADNFVRWAHALGFIEYDYYKDTFMITEKGLEYSKCEDGEYVNSRKYECSDEEKEILIDSLLSYTPAVRMLELLADGEVKTKFELSKEFGFIGEDGFTRYPQNILLKSLVAENGLKKARVLNSNREGSADKYARMICGWLEKVEMVKTVGKKFKIDYKGEIKEARIGHAFEITDKGLEALRLAKGKTRMARTHKNVWWEMLCSAKGSDRNYIRTRRAHILRILMSNNLVTVDRINSELSSLGFKEINETIVNDIKGLINIGIDISCERNGYRLNDYIQGNFIPRLQEKELVKSETAEIKEMLEKELKYVPTEYLELVDLAFNNNKKPMMTRDGSEVLGNIYFEMRTMELLSECGFDSFHLGGSRRPDGVASCKKYGIIIDTKAYANGFSVQINEADKMQRYIEDNIERDEVREPNKWWKQFPEDLDKFYFLYVSGRFVGGFEEKLQRLKNRTDVDGAVINVVNLLRLADRIMGGKLTLEEFGEKYFNNGEINF